MIIAALICLLQMPAADALNGSRYHAMHETAGIRLPADDNAQRYKNVDTSLITFEGIAQGTTYHIRYADAQQRRFQPQVDSILSAIDQSLSTYRTDSEVSTFNQFDDFQFQSGHFYTILQRSYEIWKDTNGAFDPTVMPLVEAYRTGRKTGRPWLQQVDSLLQYVGFQYISFNKTSVHKVKEHVRLDFDAIAQGYTTDVIAEYLEAKGIMHYMVEVGGELRCKGSWNVSMEDPVHPGHPFTIIPVNSRAMATSGNYRNHYEQNGHTYNHIINPKTGISRPDPLLSATVFAPDGATADAFATAFIVIGLEGTKQLLLQHKNLGAFLVYKDEKGDLQVFATEGLTSL